MGKHKRHKELDEEEVILAEATQTYRIKLSTIEWIYLGFVAMFVAGLPLVLYCSPIFDLNMEEHGIQLVPLTLLTGIALTRAFATVACKKRVVLLAERDVDARERERGKRPKEERDELQKMLSRSTSMEATCYALFLVNSIYMTSFLLMAFSAYRSLGLESRYNHFLSTALPALVLGYKSELLL